MSIQALENTDIRRPTPSSPHNGQKTRNWLCGKGKSEGFWTQGHQSLLRKGTKVPTDEREHSSRRHLGLARSSELRLSVGLLDIRNVTKRQHQTKPLWPWRLKIKTRSSHQRVWPQTKARTLAKPQKWANLPVSQLVWGTVPSSLVTALASLYPPLPRLLNKIY